MESFNKIAGGAKGETVSIKKYKSTCSRCNALFTYQDNTDSIRYKNCPHCGTELTYKLQS